jgi:hypothetical protein
VQFFSLQTNSNLAEVEFVRFWGYEVIVVSGGIVSFLPQLDEMKRIRKKKRIKIMNFI